MHSWGLTLDDPGYLDLADPAALHPPTHALCEPTMLVCAVYYDRIRAKAETPAEPDNVDGCGSGPIDERVARE